MSPVIEKCRGLCWWAFLTALLYVAAIIFVLFCDTRGESYQPPPAPSMWGYLKSWIKSAAFYRLLLQLLQFTCTLVHTIVTHIWSWVPPLSKPRGPPDPDNIRGHRARNSLQRSFDASQQHWKTQVWQEVQTHGSCSHFNEGQTGWCTPSP